MQNIIFISWLSMCTASSLPVKTKQGVWTSTEQHFQTAGYHSKLRVIMPHLGIQEKALFVWYGLQDLFVECGKSE